MQIRPKVVYKPANANVSLRKSAKVFAVGLDRDDERMQCGLKCYSSYFFIRPAKHIPHHGDHVCIRDAMIRIADESRVVIGNQ